ncbi:coenzyme Q biosynthesis protein Coq4-domain-containing protein [Schizophyllum commune]
MSLTATAQRNAIATASRCLKRSLPSVVAARRTVSTKPYPEFIKLNWFENAFLAVGSGLVALANPRRGDMVATLAETTAGPSLPRLRDIMLKSEEGRQILKERPRINTHTVDMEALDKMPEGSFGKSYVTWLHRCGVTPDTRAPVQYIEDPELAYVMQRYRECHDFYHAIVNMPVSVEYEVAVKAFEFANLGIPMTGLGAALGPLRTTGERRRRLMTEFMPWALRCGSSARSLITVYWEKRWDQNIEDMKREFGIWDPPAPKWRLKPLKEAELAAAKRKQMEQATKATL